MLISQATGLVGAFALILVGALRTTFVGAGMPAGASEPRLVSPCSPQVRPLSRPAQFGDSASSLNNDPVGQALANAFEEAGSANWMPAISAYQTAWELAACACDRQHARAGQRAAREAWFAQRMYGMKAHPTQLFWSRLQYFTRNLPCVRQS